MEVKVDVIQGAHATKHAHHGITHEHAGGNIPHDHGSRRDKPANPVHTGITLLFILACLFVVWHVGHAAMTRNAPPAACELVGGHWDVWNGWTCG